MTESSNLSPAPRSHLAPYKLTPIRGQADKENKMKKNTVQITGELALDIPTHLSSKESEIEFLATLIENLNLGTYLSSLLTGSLLNWFRHQVHDDMDCNIMAVVAHQQDVLQEQAAEFSVSGQAAKHYKEELTNLQKRMEVYTDDMRKQLKQRDIQIEEMEEEFNSANSDIEDLTQRLSEAEFEIIRLKAKLYDLTIK